MDWKEAAGGKNQGENSFGANIIRKRSSGEEEELVLSGGSKQRVALEDPPALPVPIARISGLGPLLLPLQGLQGLRG